MHSRSICVCVYTCVCCVCRCVVCVCIYIPIYQTVYLYKSLFTPCTMEVNIFNSPGSKPAFKALHGTGHVSVSSTCIAAEWRPRRPTCLHTYIRDPSSLKGHKPPQMSHSTLQCKLYTILSLPSTHSFLSIYHMFGN